MKLAAAAIMAIGTLMVLALPMELQAWPGHSQYHTEEEQRAVLQALISSKQNNDVEKMHTQMLEIEAENGHPPRRQSGKLAHGNRELEVKTQATGNVITNYCYERQCSIEGNLNFGLKHAPQGSDYYFTIECAEPPNYPCTTVQIDNKSSGKTIVVDICDDPASDFICKEVRQRDCNFFGKGFTIPVVLPIGDQQKVTIISLGSGCAKVEPLGNLIPSCTWSK